MTPAIRASQIPVPARDGRCSRCGCVVTLLEEIVPPSVPKWNERVTTCRTALGLFTQRAEPQRNGCWQWTGTVNNGYGTQLARPYGHLRYAHRLSHVLFKGPIPDGLTIDHLCRNQLCVNPDHLQAVTQLVNNRRGMAPRTILSRLNVCQKGHDLTGAPRTTKGFRYCRKCHAAQETARKRRLGVKPANRLSPEEIRGMRELRLAGMTWIQIGKAYNRHPTVALRNVRRIAA